MDAATLAKLNDYFSAMQSGGATTLANATQAKKILAALTPDPPPDPTPDPDPIPDPSPDPEPSAGWPDETTTGPDPSITLTPSGTVRTTTAGQVIENLDVSGFIYLMHDNCVVRNCKVTNTGYGTWGVRIGANNCTVQDTWITGPVEAGGNEPGRLQYGVGAGQGNYGTKILRVRVTDTSNSIDVSSGVVQDCLVHNMGYIDGDHVDAICTFGGGPAGHSLLIDHNTILDNHQGGGAIMVQEALGDQHDVTVSNNWIAGGGFGLYGGGPDHGGAVPMNIKVTGNRWSTQFFPGGGFYGAVSYYDSSAPGTEWSDNLWADGPNAGQPVNG